MKSGSLLSIAISLLLVLCCASASLATFPKPDNIYQPTLRQGWFNNQLAWYVTSDTNDTYWARTDPDFPILARKLSSALMPRFIGGDIAARPMYVVQNPAQSQGPVFADAPGQTPLDQLYSGLWQVFYVKWLPGAVKRPIISADPESLANPGGIPGPGEAVITPTNIVVARPIFAIGPLGGPWQETPPGGYRMPQITVPGQPFYPYLHIVTMPLWRVFWVNFITKSRVLPFPLAPLGTDVVGIPDVSDAELAALLGANLAPGLLNVPDSDTQPFWVMNDPKPPSQLPMTQNQPLTFDANELNTNYTPVVQFTVLQRNIAPATVVNNPTLMQLLIGNGGLVVLRNDQRMIASEYY